MTERRRGHTVDELLKVGDEILVQIVKEPRGLKGARVSTNVSLPGRYLVLMPTGSYSGVSSRIDDENERNRLKLIMRKLRPEGMATIVRTAARASAKPNCSPTSACSCGCGTTSLNLSARERAGAAAQRPQPGLQGGARLPHERRRAVIIDSKEQYEEIRSTMSLLGPQYLTG